MEQTVGKILKGVGGLYTVRLTEDPELPVGTEISCRARGSFRYEHMTPLPGDTVTLTRSEEGRDDFVIDTIKERKNSFL